MENWQELEGDKEKERTHFHIPAGEAITLQVGSLIEIYDRNKEEIVNMEDALEHPEFYLQVIGSGVQNGEGMILEKNLNHIYIKCE